MNKIKIEEMDLQQISKDIVAKIQFEEKFIDATFESLSAKVEKIVKEQVVDVLEPEGVYNKGEFYEGLGYYIGIVDTYPWNSDYFKRQHHFRNPNDYRGVPSEIKKILIREIKK